ncbi:hypothetical protein [Paenibacillus sp. NPDC058177]|uniref:hypothetical protein n=1 Tax=Paenibacillus sp. NPDC058177 TaxID=3346369 RepID=UPI0036DBA704
MKRQWLQVLAVAFVLTAVLVGCSGHQIRKEADKYSMKAYEDGVLRAQSQGKGLNGRFLGEMRRSFAGEGIKLTHEMFAEDSRGNVSYQYLIAGQPSQNITLHVFSNLDERKERIPEWYGSSDISVTPTTKTEIYSKYNASLVYTSMGKEKAKYSKKIKSLFTGLLERLNLSKDEPPEHLKKLQRGTEVYYRPTPTSQS